MVRFIHTVVMSEKKARKYEVQGIMSLSELTSISRFVDIHKCYVLQK